MKVLIHAIKERLEVARYDLYTNEYEELLLILEALLHDENVH